MTPLERDMHLQELILQGDEERTRAFYNEEKIPRPLSRVLGYACRYGSPQIVQMLVDGGAQMYYRRTKDSIGENGIADRSSLSDVLEPYLYLLDPDDGCSVVSNRLQDLDKEHRRTTGEAYDETVRILTQNAYKTGFDPSDMLFFAALYEDEEAVRALEKAGAPRLYGKLFELMSDQMWGNEAADYDDYMDEYYRVIVEMAVEQMDLRPLLRRLCMIVDGPVRLREIPWDEKGEVEPWEDSALRALLEYTTLGRHVRKRDFLAYCACGGCKQTLDWALDNGWARSWKDYENLKEIAAETDDSGELEALLLQKQRDSGFKSPMDRSVNPFSAANLRRTWSTRQPKKGAEDGLEISSYKGTDDASSGNVVVPDRIGKRTVTSLDRETFSPFSARTEEIKQAREQITELTIPGTITHVPPSLMSCHKELRRAEIGEGTVSIGKNAFARCETLEEVVLPQSLGFIDAGAFRGCSNLRSVEIGKDVRISPSAFLGCSALVDSSGFVRVGGRIAAADVLKLPAALALMEDPGVYEPFRRLLPMLTYRQNPEAERAPTQIPTNLKAGDEFVFGQFPYDTDYVLQPLQWTCVAREGDTALCITRDAIALLYAHWERAEKWLDRVHRDFNEAFLPVMFSAEERELLKKNGGLADSQGQEMFLLLRRDIEQWMPKESTVRRCSATPYATGQIGTRAGGDGWKPGSWIAADYHWDALTTVLPDSGDIVKRGVSGWGYWRDFQDSADCGDIDETERFLGVRPAIHIRVPQTT